MQIHLGHGHQTGEGCRCPGVKNALPHHIPAVFDGVCSSLLHVPSLKLTVRPWKWMVGIQAFPIGFRHIFRGETVSFREGTFLLDFSSKVCSAESWVKVKVPDILLMSAIFHNLFPIVTLEHLLFRLPFDSCNQALVYLQPSSGGWKWGIV